MTLEEFKKQIDLEIPLTSALIFLNSENSFLSEQYVKYVSEKLKLKISYVDDLTTLLPDKNDIFGCGVVIDSTYLYIHHVEKCEYTDEEIKNVSNLIIITDKIDKKSVLYDIVIEMPKLETWQIKDYVYSIADGVNTKKLDWLISVAKNDIYRLDNECRKLALFNVKERDKLFEIFASEDAYSDLSNYMIFDLSTAIVKKDLKTISYILEDLKNIDVEPIGLATVLYNNFRDILSIQLDRTASAEKLGMNPKKFYAVSKSCGFYNKEQLIEIFDCVSGIDFKLKTGQLPADKIIDYMILKILSV